MRRQTVLIIGEHSRSAEDLRAALDGDGWSAVVVGVGELETALGGVVDLAGYVFVSSVLVDAVVERLCARVSAARAGPVRAVVYAETATDDLHPHVRSGRDYVLPPYRSGVLRRRLGPDGEEAERMADDAANLARYERELQIAHEIQTGFLPEQLPKPAGWQIEVRFHPARQVAGDFYDAYDLVGGRRIGFVVADVCDKGVGAALFMALIRSLLRNTASHTGSLSVVALDVEWDAEPGADGDGRTSTTAAGIGPLLNAVTGTDQYLIQNHLQQGYFATLFFGILDPVTGGVIYINGGHNPPMLRRTDGTLVHLGPTGPALGILPGASYRLGHVQLGPGDLLYLYTDGVTEAKDENGAFFGEERVRGVLHEPGDAQDVLTRFDEELERHVGAAERFDDITMMALYRQPAPASPGGRPAAPSREEEPR